MPEYGKITYKQLIQLVFISRIILTITYLPALSAPPGNQDIWLAELLSFPILLLFSVPVYFLSKRFPNQTIIQYSQTVMGNAGKLIGILYVWFFIHFTAITVIQFVQFLSTAVMPETPNLFFAVSLTLFCAYAVEKGIEVLGRLSEIIGPIMIIAIIGIALLLVKDMDLKALTPIMEHGVLPILHGGFTIAARTVEIVGIAILLSYLNNKEKAKTVFIVSFTLIIVFFLIITIPVLTTFGVEQAKNRSFPFFSTVKLVSVGNFIERVEAIHMGIWVLGTFVKVSLYYYFSVLAISQLFNLKSYKTMILPMGTIIIPLSILIAPSLVELREFTSYKIFTWYSLFFMVFIPTILLMITFISKKGVQQK